MEPKKKGRPYLGDEKRSVMIRVKMEPKEADELDFIAEQLNTTRSGVVRRGIELLKKELSKEK